MTEKTYRRPQEGRGDGVVFGARYDQKTLAGELKGLVAPGRIEEIVGQLALNNSDEYIESVLANGSDPTLTGAPEVIARLGQVEELHRSGPLFVCRLRLESADAPTRTVGVIAQNRQHNNGAWLPEHHRTASRFFSEFSAHLYPVVTFVDTPGAEAGETANLNNQAHSISHLIAEAAHARVPVISVLYGLGYSGGAIPLYCGNLLLALSHSVFSTIQPQGLSSIAKKLDLSWQQCARIVGISCWQLYQQGLLDGIVDYDPAQPDIDADKLRDCLVSAFELLDTRARQNAVSNKEFNKEFTARFQQIAPRIGRDVIQAQSGLSFTAKSALNLPNAIGYYLQRQRWMHLLGRLQTSETSRFGLLSDYSVPEGEQLNRMRLERDAHFYGWIQNTPRLVYDEKITRLWKKFLSTREQRQQERGRLSSILFGRPEENYRKATNRLCAGLMRELYNQWKSNAEGNLKRLIYWLQRTDRLEILYQVADIPRDYQSVLTRLSKHKPLFDLACRTFTHEGRKFLLEDAHRRRTESFVRNQICLELNLLLNHPNLYSALQPQTPGTDIVVIEHEVLRNNKTLLDQALGIEPSISKENVLDKNIDELTLLDLLTLSELQPALLSENLNLIIFNQFYNHLLGNMHLLSGHGQQSWSLDFDSTAKLYGELCAQIVHSLDKKYGLGRTQLQDDFNGWVVRLSEDSGSVAFLGTVDEWKRREFPRVSETFFAILSHIFHNVLPSLLRALHHSGSFDGRIQPLNIGQRKDFWNRLHLAWRDLNIDRLLARYKRDKPVEASAFIELFFSNFEESHRDLISADPCSFPGFRRSLDACIKSDRTPCGVITGTGTLKGRRRRVGVLLSNPAFQAGSFDMAGCRKFVSLLDECEKDNLPVVLFVSSGGMQTKEGAAALFSMAISNQRITDFVLRTGLPVLVFAYGDCTGGAQASFVTHPLVQTWYCSGAYLPFAGRIVVPEHLPLASILSNYLAAVPGAMRGLVRHPFYSDLDAALRAIDPGIQLPQNTIPEVISTVLAGKSPGESTKKAASARGEGKDQASAVILRPIEKLLIHARGCTAAKLVRIAQQENIPVVLVQSDPDLDSAVADQLKCPPDQLVGIGGNTPDQSYLNGDSILRVAEQCQVDALHPGIGFLSENAAFARQCIKRNINFIGPSPTSMDLMGNKSNAISTAIGCGVPAVPGSHGIVADVEQAKVVGQRIAYPLILKAVHGGGGRGIEIVRQPEDMYQSFFRVVSEARSAFGNGDIYIEKLIERLRHIEVQILRDHRGNIKIPGLRDCSVQRNRQKIIEESASTVLSQRLRRKAFAAARALARGVDYIGAGTVEFIHDLDSDEIFFMEMNTRLQVEHPVTELTAGVDIVAEQLRIATGASISRLRIEENGYAIEARINAERTAWDQEGKCLKFYPDPGHIRRFELPASAGIETISAVGEGKNISPYYDSMIVQVIAHGRTRPATIRKLRRYLDSVVIEGVSTNIPLLKKILSDKVFIGGEYDTNYLSGLFGRIHINQFLRDCRDQSSASAETDAQEIIKIPDSQALKVLAPSTGVCYLTPSPNEAEYISEGKRFGYRDTLCQIEAMKVYSPVSLEQINLQAQANLYGAEKSWQLLRTNVSNGALVNAGDLLFVIEPLDS